MSDELLPILTAIHKDVGEIKGKLDAHIDAFAGHVQDDKKAYQAIFELKQAAARQRGFISALTLFGSVIGSAVGWTVHKLLGH